MPIRYSLVESRLPTTSNAYVAQVRSSGSLGLDDIVADILSQGSTSTEADIRAVHEDMVKAIERALLDGKRVNFGGLFELFPTVKGTFDGPTDAYDPARHTVDVGANPGSRIRKTVRARARLRKVRSVKPAPSVLEYADLGSGTTNATVTPGNIGTIRGSRLKFDPAAPDEGIFFIPTGGGAETRVTFMAQNVAKELIFQTPDALASGSYRLEVRVVLRNGVELRTGRLDDTLTVP